MFRNIGRLTSYCCTSAQIGQGKDLIREVGLELLSELRGSKNMGHKNAGSGVLDEWADRRLRGLVSLGGR